MVNKNENKDQRIAGDTGNGSFYWWDNVLSERRVASRTYLGNRCSGAHLRGCRCGHDKGKTVNWRNKDGAQKNVYSVLVALIVCFGCIGYMGPRQESDVDVYYV